MAVNPDGIPKMCPGLHRSLGGLCQRHPKQTACGGRQRQRLDELHRKTEQHAEAADFSAGEEDTVLLEEARESHRCHMDVHPWLQSPSQKEAGSMGRAHIFLCPLLKCTTHDLNKSLSLIPNYHRSKIQFLPFINSLASFATL